MAWEDEKITITCPSSHYIHIVHSFYGFGVCRSPLAEEVVKIRYHHFEKYSIKFRWYNICISYMEHISSLSLLLRCEGKLLCSMIVGDDTFGQPCPSLKKYLEVTYACIQGNEYWISINKARWIFTYNHYAY